MREILFRGKRKDNGKWIEGYLCKKYSQEIPHERNVIQYKTEYDSRMWKPDYMAEEIIPDTVGQYTGLTDKNGKKIFEGDIANCITSDFDGSDKYIYNFKITDITDYEQMGFLDFCHEIKIIGNIHDNPELLKGETNA